MCKPIRRSVAPLIGLFGLLASGCGAGGAAAVGSGEKSQSSGSAAAATKWTPEKVSALFLDAAGAGLTGGKSHTVPQGTIDKIILCVPLNPLKMPTVPVEKTHSTTGQESGVAGKGRIVQEGWVLPDEAKATELSRQIDSKMSECRYSGSTQALFDKDVRVDSSSTTHAYPRDEFGWQGHRIEQTMALDRKRNSVSTELLVRRGPVILRLHYINYTPKTAEPELRSQNLSVLRKVLAHPA
ncbi:hypothetical protein [Streptosporangium sp. KLBMP 9127]|nr:hypothetical protein [Streptosporangium sp. KLBMP 9127]